MNITRGKVAKAQKCILYGMEGIGKSSLAAKFPDPLFIDTEGSTANMDVARTPKVSSWTMLNQQVDEVKRDKLCKTLAIDTVDWAERMAIEKICSDAQKTSIEDFGYGSGYIKLEEELGRFLNKLQDVVDSGINVVLTAHAQIRKFEQPDEMGAYDRYELKLGKKTSARTSALVKEWADMVLFINYKTLSVASAVDSKGNATKHKAQGGTRTVYATHSPAWDAKNRHSLPDEFPLEGGYEKYLAPIFDKVPKAITSAPQTRQQSTPSTQTAPVSEPPKQAVSEPQQATMDDYNPKLNPAIPQALRDLMLQAKVSEEEIQAVVANNGYYPIDTPITNYSPEFINAKLVGVWELVFIAIKEFRKTIPFN
jgi:hypothetical protein